MRGPSLFDPFSQEKLSGKNGKNGRHALPLAEKVPDADTDFVQNASAVAKEMMVVQRMGKKFKRRTVHLQSVMVTLHVLASDS